MERSHSVSDLRNRLQGFNHSNSMLFQIALTFLNPLYYFPDKNFIWRRCGLLSLLQIDHDLCELSEDRSQTLDEAQRSAINLWLICFSHSKYFYRMSWRQSECEFHLYSDLLCLVDGQTSALSTGPTSRFRPIYNSAPNSCTIDALRQVFPSQTPIVQELGAVL